MKKKIPILTETDNVFGKVHYTMGHSGKMDGLISLSTDINSNPLCQARMKMRGAVCQHCFSERLWDDDKGRYRGGNDSFKTNAKILSKHLLTDDEIPYINYKRWPLFRFEAFGDLRSVLQALNYLRIAKKNPKVRFALFTKNPGFLSRALRLVPKPDNLQVVLSSLFMNKQARGNFPFVDKIFTVYDEAFITRNKVQINCGARSCLACQRCYLPNPNGEKVQQVREQVK